MQTYLTRIEKENNLTETMHKTQFRKSFNKIRVKKLRFLLKISNDNGSLDLLDIREL